MFIRGTDVHVPLTFTRIQPYVSPKIELSDERQERVDLRVLPLIFHFAGPRRSTCIPVSWSMFMSAQNKRTSTSTCGRSRADIVMRRHRSPGARVRLRRWPEFSSPRCATGERIMPTAREPDRSLSP